MRDALDYGPWYHVKIGEVDLEFHDEKAAKAFKKSLDRVVKKYFPTLTITSDEIEKEETDWS